MLTEVSIGEESAVALDRVQQRKVHSRRHNRGRHLTLYHGHNNYIHYNN